MTNAVSDLNTSLRAIGSFIGSRVSSAVNKTVNIVTNVADRCFPQCAICTERTYVKSPLTQCHTFHRECLSKWAKINPTCPYDRRPLTLRVDRLRTLKFVGVFSLLAAASITPYIANNQFAETNYHTHVSFNDNRENPYDRLERATENGDLNVVNDLITSNQIAYMNDWNIGEGLERAAGNNYLDIVNALIASPQFVDTHVYHWFLGKSLEKASINGNLEIVNALLASTGSAKITDLTFARSLIHASIYGHSDIVKTLIACPQFAKIDVWALGSSLSIATQRGHSDIAKTLIACSRFAEIPERFISESIN